MSACRSNQRPRYKSFRLAATAASCLLLAACDHTVPAKVEQSGAAPAVREKTGTVATAPSADRPAASAPLAVKPSVAARKSSDPPRASPDSNSPVTATIRTDKSAVRVGESFTVIVDVQIASGWHIYAIDRPTGVALPTKIRLELPAGLESTSKWTSPEPSLDDSSAGEPAFVYHDAAAFQQTLRVKQGATTSPMVIRAELSYQVCDRFSCRAPTTLKLQTSIQIVP